MKSIPLTPVTAFNSATELRAAPPAFEVPQVVDALVDGQARSLGVRSEFIMDAELARGRQLDERVTQSQMDSVTALYVGAQLRFGRDHERRNPDSGPTILFAPTARVIDHGTPETAIGALAAELIRNGKLDELKNAIDLGPGSGSDVWNNPTTPVELVASVIRWGCLRGGDKKRIRPTAEVRAWMGETLAAHGIETSPKLGCVSAVGTMVARALKARPTMMSLGDVPPDLTPHLPADLPVVSDRPGVSTFSEIPREPRPNAHYCLAIKDLGTLGLPEELGEVRVNGEPRSTDAVRHLDILVTGSSQVPGFGTLPLERTRALGSVHELMVLSGAQALDGGAAIAHYFSHVRAVHEAGTHVALLYSEAKNPDQEVAMWKALRESRAVDFIGMNTGEAFDALARIARSAETGNPLGLAPSTVMRLRAALTLGARESCLPHENGRETPEWIFRAASLLQEVLETPAVRVRGKASDVVVTGANVGISDPDAVRDHLIVSRHLGVLKTAMPKGLVTEPGDVTFLRNTPSGVSLAALHAVRDEIRSEWTRAGESPPGGTATLAHRCYDPLPGGRTCFAIPPVSMYVKTGGTQSAGDTIDVSFAISEVGGLMRDAHRSWRTVPGRTYSAIAA